MTPSPASATPSALGITEHATAKQQPAAAGEPGDGTWDGDVERLSSAVG